MTHYTSKSENAFINRITFDFIAELERKMEVAGITQSEVAKKLNVSEGNVSQVLNLGRMNLSLKTMVRFARALGMKIAVVAYEDDDPKNERGPVGSEIFTNAWKKLGKPRDVWSLNQGFQIALTSSVSILLTAAYSLSAPHFSNSTAARLLDENTAKELPDFPMPMSFITEANTNARNEKLSFRL
jgi:transcriptional regulator with XRE-family HTH domain